MAMTSLAHEVALRERADLIVMPCAGCHLTGWRHLGQDVMVVYLSSAASSLANTVMA